MRTVKKMEENLQRVGDLIISMSEQTPDFSESIISALQELLLIRSCIENGELVFLPEEKEEFSIISNE